MVVLDIQHSLAPAHDSEHNRAQKVRGVAGE